MSHLANHTPNKATTACGVCVFALFACTFASYSGNAEELVKFAISRTDGNKYRQEFEQYECQAEYYRQNGIKATLLDTADFMDPRADPKKVLNELRKYHVVGLLPFDEGVRAMTPEKAAQADAMGKVFAEYVQAGGGLLIQPSPVRYPGNDDEIFWNMVFKHFGFSIAREGICDLKTMRTLPLKMNYTADYFRTGNISPHPMTKDVKNLWLPVRSYTNYPGTPLMDYGPAWQVVVRGNDPCGTYINDDATNSLDLKRSGNIKREPPIVAWRASGKGRVAVIPVHNIFTGINYKTKVWANIVEYAGADGIPSDMMRLFSNTVTFLAEPARGDKAFGSYEPEEYKPVQFPERVSWDSAAQTPVSNQVHGIIGAHSSLSDGRSGVAEYVEAAKKAGLKAIAFTESLEIITPENFSRLKEECARHSNADFYAVPGMEFTDGAGIRWIFVGEKVVYPDNRPFVNRDFTHTLLGENKRIKHYGQYAFACAFPPSAIVDYSSLAANKVRRENLWWFYNVIPYAYEDDRLIADNSGEYAFASHDLRIIMPLPFTRIRSATEVPAAARTATFSTRNLDSTRNLFSTFTNQRFTGERANLFVNYGSRIEINLWNAVNSQMDPRPLFTRGVQRIRAFFDVTSPDGIKELKIVDSNGSLFRRFEGNGEKHLRRELEFVHDKQHFLYLDVMDMNGKRAFSRPLWLFDYKQGLFRCGDNLNILGPLGYWWHPDRNELLPLLKQFRNGEFFSVQGWDRAQADCPVPHGHLQNAISLEGIGAAFPRKVGSEIPAMRMNVVLAGGEVQVVDAIMEEYAEGHDNAMRPSPPRSSPARIVHDNPYFIHTQRMYSPRDRMNHHVAWDHRRLRESLKEYDGAIHVFKGEITFKQDVTLQKTADVPLLLATAFIEPNGVSRGMEGVLIFKDLAGMTQSRELGKTSRKYAGRLAPDGFVAELRSPLGYLALLPLDGTPWNYAYAGDVLRFGPGEAGSTYEKGDKISYAFASANIISTEPNDSRMKHLSALLRGVYPLDVRVGRKVDAVGLLQLAASQNEACFTVGPEKGLGIDLPIAVSGLDDKGCVAVFSTKRPWFRFIGVAEGDSVAYVQEPMDEKNTIWIGNVFVCDNKDLRLTLVVDGQDAGKQPFLEVHNPGNGEAVATVTSPANAPCFGGRSFRVTVPPGDSVIHSTDGKRLEK